MDSAILDQFSNLEKLGKKNVNSEVIKTRKVAERKLTLKCYR